MIKVTSPGLEPAPARSVNRNPNAGRRLPLRPVAALGGGSLLATIAGSAWSAVGTARGVRWLELPSGGAPGFIEGPLHGLTGGGPLSSSSLGAGLIVIALAYLVTLACAGSIPLRLVLGAVVAANAAFTLGPSLLSTDVFGYIAYAREGALHGLNPYVLAPSALAPDPLLQYVYWRHEPSPYGPLFTFASLPLGLVSLTAALWSYKLLAGVASIALAFLVADIARTRTLHPARAAAFVGLNPVLLFYAVSGAHNDLLAVALATGAVALTLRSRPGAGAGIAVAAASIKATLGLALPFVLILAHRRRAALGAAIALLAIGAPTLALFGVHVFAQLQRISSQARFDIAGSGPDRLASALGTHITPALRAACTGAAALAALAALVWAWRGADAITAAGWAFAALLAAIASLAPWYLVWLLPLAAVGCSRALRTVALLGTGYLIATHLPLLGGQPWLSGP
ncbi:MAG: glycosyltransferase 87 family protein [Solirubrobacteraceae bacterium]